MRLRQQGVVIGKDELLTTKLEHFHVADAAAQREVTAIEVGHVEEGILGILAWRMACVARQGSYPVP